MEGRLWKGDGPGKSGRLGSGRIDAALIRPSGLALVCRPLALQELYNETDAVTGGWLSHAASLLTACSAQLPSCGSGGSGGSAYSGGPLRVTHVAVTSGQLIPSLAKLLLFRLVPHIAPQHVWSSRYEGKQRCFERVRRRFGDRCTYLAIGAGASCMSQVLQLMHACMRASQTLRLMHPGRHTAQLRGTVPRHQVPSHTDDSPQLRPACRRRHRGG